MKQTEITYSEKEDTWKVYVVHYHEYPAFSREKIQGIMVFESNNRDEAILHALEKVETTKEKGWCWVTIEGVEKSLTDTHKALVSPTIQGKWLFHSYLDAENEELFFMEDEKTYTNKEDAHSHLKKDLKVYSKYNTHVSIYNPKAPKKPRIVEPSVSRGVPVLFQIKA